MTPLTVRYEGGSLDGVTRLSADDQVPATVCTSSWERYEIAGRVYEAGLLVDVTYRHQS